jgi:hypothetical protein
LVGRLCDYQQSLLTAYDAFGTSFRSTAITNNANFCAIISNKRRGMVQAHGSRFAKARFRCEAAFPDLPRDFAKVRVQ